MEVAALDPARPVVIEAESSKVGGLVVPPSVWKAMIGAERVEVAAPVAARADYLARAYADLTADGRDAGVDGWRSLAPDAGGRACGGVAGSRGGGAVRGTGGRALHGITTRAMRGTGRAGSGPRGAGRGRAARRGGVSGAGGRRVQRTSMSGGPSVTVPIRAAR
jgi:hypothetical protein